MTPYYPFGLFEGRTLPELDFLEITILYGGNAAKTTLLNVMADALSGFTAAQSIIERLFDDYARLCKPRTARPHTHGQHDLDQ